MIALLEERGGVRNETNRPPRGFGGGGGGGGCGGDGGGGDGGGC